MTAVDTEQTVELEEIGFSTVQVCRIVGCSIRQADYWDRTGLLSPSVSRADGSGSIRRYSHSDLLLLMVVVDLLEARGVHQKSGTAMVQRLSSVVDYLRPLLGGDLSDALLVIVGDRHAFVHDARQIVSVVRSSTDTLTVVKLSDLEARIAQRILDLFPVVARSHQSSGKSTGGSAGSPDRACPTAPRDAVGAPTST